MSNTGYPVDPMAAFYAAVTAVENGQVAEVELEYRSTTPDDHEVVLTMSVRRDVRSIGVLGWHGEDS